jgi:hypothetical protein
MERRTTALSAEQFLMNLRALKSKMRSPLPSDVLYYKCSTCSLKLPLNSAGIVAIESNLCKSVGDCIHQLLQNLVKIHSKTATCSGTLELDSVETPDNIIISFPASDTAYIEKFKIGNDPYKIMIMVQPESLAEKVICVLYQKETVDSKTYFEFFDCNYVPILDVAKVASEDDFEEEAIQDDESFNLYQHDLQRMTGGGRSLHSKYNYECQWCSKDVLKAGQKGKFRELRSYRRHFDTFHYLKEGIPKSEFEDEVKRSDPKWYCRVCRNSYSLGNVVRHKEACWQTGLDSDDDSDEDDDAPGEQTAKQNKMSEAQSFNLHKKDSSSKGIQANGCKRQKKRGEERQSATQEDSEEGEPIAGSNNKVRCDSKQGKEVERKESFSEKKRTNLDESVSSSDGENDE